jgi:hypothetical protein
MEFLITESSPNNPSGVTATIQKYQQISTSFFVFVVFIFVILTIFKVIFWNTSPNFLMTESTEQLKDMQLLL